MGADRLFLTTITITLTLSITCFMCAVNAIMCYSEITFIQYKHFPWLIHCIYVPDECPVIVNIKPTYCVVMYLMHLGLP